MQLAREGADLILANACADAASFGHDLANRGGLAEAVKLVDAEGRRVVSDRVDVVAANAGIAGSEPMA